MRDLGAGVLRRFTPGHETEAALEGKQPFPHV